MGTRVVDYRAKINASSEFIRHFCLTQKIKDMPQILLVCGSGFREIADQWPTHGSLDMGEIPGFTTPAVAGHGSKLTFVSIQGTPVLIATGRRHLYENISVEDIVHPVRVAADLGIKKLILTNAAGSVQEFIKPGSLVLIKDHINLLGKNPEITSPSQPGNFIDLTDAYSTQWRHKVPQHLYDFLGVYASLSGPSYETRAEAKMLSILGADVVGMSTVLECIAAKSLGMDVLGVSLVTNYAGKLFGGEMDHAAVLKETQQHLSRLRLLVESSLSQT
jgi:purine-nucleoside phosphorylase